MGYLDHNEKESTTSRFIQQKSPTAPGSEGRKSGESVGKPMADDAAIAAKGNAGGSHPETDLKAQREAGQYGKVHVVAETQLGELILVDDTPGSNRILILHPSGTYTVFESSGNETQKVNGDLYTLVSKNWKVEVKADELVFIHGNEQVKIDVNRNIDVGAAETTKIGTTKTDDIGTEWTVNVGTKCTIIAGAEVTVQAPIIKLN